jgi:hypothetical protein
MNRFFRIRRTIMALPLVFTALLGVSNSVQAQEVNEKIVPVFVYNFTKYVKWPEAANQHSFTIGVVDNPAVLASFEKMAAANKVNGQPILIKKVRTSADAENCQLVYVSGMDGAKLREIAEPLRAMPVLIVSAKNGLLRKGSDINFFVDEDDGMKTRFEINQATLEGHGLKVSRELLNLAYTVVK